MDREPKRKTSCPHCGQPIYVRGGKLVREDQLAEAKAKPNSKKPTSGNGVGSAASAKKPPRPKAKPQGQLAADMKKRKETYSQKDLMAGLQLLLRVAGVLIAGGGLGKMLSSFLTGEENAVRSEASLVGLLEGVDVDQLLQSISEAYTSLNEEEQFQMRAVASWLQNGFRLPAEREA
ncbi:MAG: hypothetical protein NZ553_09705 [Caldilinea sp.]|nr:hypothetical protein [Caldilinea sp.]MDW8440736.1 hypothetical protein [Caldilineaceae bacterium]